VKGSQPDKRVLSKGKRGERADLASITTLLRKAVAGETDHWEQVERILESNSSLGASQVKKKEGETHGQRSDGGFV